MKKLLVNILSISLLVIGLNFIYLATNIKLLNAFAACTTYNEETGELIPCGDAEETSNSNSCTANGNTCNGKCRRKNEICGWSPINGNCECGVKCSAPPPKCGEGYCADKTKNCKGSLACKCS